MRAATTINNTQAGHGAPPHTVVRSLYKLCREAGEWSDAIGSTYKQLGAKPGDRVGIFGGNTREWMLSMQVGGFLGCS